MPQPEEEVSDEELEDEEMEEGEYDDIDLAGLLQSLLVADDGETNLPTAVVNLTQTIDKHMAMQNKILVKILSKIGNDSDLYIQNIVNNKIKWQNSEVFGFNRNIAKEIFQPIIDDRLLMENRLWTVSHSGKYNVLILPSMPNTRQIRRGGDNALLKAL